ncbi:MAG: HupE/UreJ family protein [Rhodobacteraceae bacterium]|nr:HupE/UreJ family protein [Paracoccaceae bacterium]
MRWTAVFSLFLLMAPSVAHAHLVGVEFGEFYAGALHLILDPGQLAALVALALIAGLQPRESGRWVLAGQPAGLAAGLGIGLFAPIASPIEPLMGAALAMTGLLAATALKLPIVVLVGAAGLAAALVGYVNGVSVDPGAGTIDWRLYAGGALFAGTMVGALSAAIAAVVADAAQWAPIAHRVLGSWIGAAGVMYLGLALAG